MLIRHHRKKSGGPNAQALGRSRGGFSTKVHVATADERSAVAIPLTPGQEGDAKALPDLRAGVPAACPATFAVADRGDDSNAIRVALMERDLPPVIPSNANRVVPIPHDEALYRGRNRVERRIGKRKQFRAIATRYDQPADSFLAFLHLVAAFIAIR